MADQAIWVVLLKGGTPRKICDLPENWASWISFTVNADETVLLGGGVIKDAKEPNFLFTADIKTGEIKIVRREPAELGHVQFSPTDSDLCMFSHEGFSEAIDRIWFINPSKSKMDAAGNVTSNAHLVFKRTEPREIVTHEFWEPNGKYIWFQQAYRGRKPVTEFFGRLEVAKQKVTQYQIPPGFGGIHQTWAPDGTFLIIDGGGRKGDTKPGPDKYISKLTLPTDGSNVLKGEHVVTMHANDYAVGPNPHVSPNGRWVTFTATLHGTAQVYAVDLQSKSRTPLLLAASHRRAEMSQP
jgi:oligogalacturonide lyase